MIQTEQKSLSEEEERVLPNSENPLSAVEIAVMTLFLVLITTLVLAYSSGLLEIG